MHIFTLEDGHKLSLTLPKSWTASQQDKQLLVASNGEDRLIIVLGGMQSGHTTWGVMYAECDGYVRSHTGYSTNDETVELDINAALYELSCRQMGYAA